MNKSQIIQNTIQFVKETLEGAEGGHDWFHIERVYKNALLISENEKVDSFIVELGALLHDIADAKFYDGDESIGPKKARAFLKSQLVEEEVRDIEEGEILVKNLYLSFDPTQRGWLNDVPSYIPPVQIGEVMRAGSVGKVIESKNQNFSEDDIVQGSFGWQEYAISGEGSGFMPPQKLHEGISPTSALSIYGITGLTAYFGMLDIGKPEQMILFLYQVQQEQQAQ